MMNIFVIKRKYLLYEKDDVYSILKNDLQPSNYLCFSSKRLSNSEENDWRDSKGTFIISFFDIGPETGHGFRNISVG